MDSEQSLTIVFAEGATAQELLAAKEARRYLYLRTGQLLPLVGSENGTIPETDLIVVARKDRPVVSRLLQACEPQSAVAALEEQQYLLRTIQRDGRKIALVIGGDAIGTLYGAYRFAEHLGVRFYLHGDVVPDGRVPLELPGLDEEGKPLFNLRGILPFHDFAEGPDWWNTDDYQAILAQVAKLRMNFIGLHTYPEGPVGPEPTVWIGLTEDIGDDGRVNYSYPTSYMNTLRRTWDYAPKKTGEFSFGGSQLFERDDYGSEIMLDVAPTPKTMAESNEVFYRTAKMLNEAFQFAHDLGIKTCVGTEVPLTVPRLVKERVREPGKGSASSTTSTPIMRPSWVMRMSGQGQDDPGPAVVQELYEGVFRRIMQAYPLDYYWLWTPEHWIWPDVGEMEVQATERDLRAALAVAEKVNAPFTLVACGWVLGPPKDRTRFDRVLPKHVPVSCISKITGRAPLDPHFGAIQGRPRWAIPWPEDDGCLISPQLWVGRMRRDAADALAYGCTGLIGNHWRTRILGPNILGLAWAAWDQSRWNKPAVESAAPNGDIEIVGGRWSSFASSPIAGTEDAPLYQTMEYEISAYRLKLPKGVYTVTLKFCEPWYSSPGKRLFGVKLQGARIIDKLDIAAEVGINTALDYTFEDVQVDDGQLDIEFEQIIGVPLIAAIAVEGPAAVVKINCGGHSYQDYSADVMPYDVDHYPPTDDFYADWTLHEFGPEVADEAARIFRKIDGKLPEPSSWEECPGAISVNPLPWEEVAGLYAFVDELAELAPRVRGAGNQERFNYWLNSFRFMRATAQVGCSVGELNHLMRQVNAETDPATRKKLAEQEALPQRKQLVQQWGEMATLLLTTVNDSSEMGMFANIEQHSMGYLQRLTMHDAALETALGRALPTDTQPWRDYRGPVRIIVPTKRTILRKGEALRLKVIILAQRGAHEAVLLWRSPGQGEYHVVPLTHVARGVYRVTIPAEQIGASDFEYHIRVTADGQEAYHPATAPAIAHTVVVMP